MPTYDGPHCELCKHKRFCALPQKDEGKVCGWYNAQVSRVISKAKAKHHIKAISG